MKTRIRITHSNYKWTYFSYLNSGARGRMSTSVLNRKFNEGQMEAINPSNFTMSNSKEIFETD